MEPEPAGFPRYWMREASGVLAPVVEAYLHGKPLQPAQIVVMKMYLRQWIMAPVWLGGAELASLREMVDSIETQGDIRAWLNAAVEWGHDPL